MPPLATRTRVPLQGPHYLTLGIKEITCYVFVDFAPVCVLQGGSRILISGVSD